MIGQTLGHYRVREQLGAGGMGVVYVARDERLDRDVALKVLPPDTLADEDARKRFRKEALALSKLSHPGIGTIFDFDTQNGTDFLVMEFVPGVTLDSKLAAGPLSERETRAIAVQLAEAVAVAHDAGIVHRDLKPANLRLQPDGRLKILDFGLARLVKPLDDRSLTASVTAATLGVSGTLGYMAPEQLRGQPADPRSDLYSIGVALYEMLTGRRPFEHAVSTALVGDILHAPPVPIRHLAPSVSPELERIVLKCLEKDPARRYQFAAELAVDLRRLDAAKQSLQPPTFRPGARRAAVTALVAIVALAVVIGMAVLGRGTNGPPLPAKPSIAVLPLQNMSPDAANEYFSDGMTEEITSKLSRIAALEVAARTSVARFKGTQQDVKDIGRELGVRYVLEGSVRKQSDRVRVTVQLIDTTSGFHLWSDDFDGGLEDVFAVQEQTALKIAEALELNLTPQEQRAVRRSYTRNVAAYDAYLRGHALSQNFDNPAQLEAARQYFDRALAAEADYAPALAEISHIEGWYHRNIAPDPARLRRAETLARRALELDPQLAVAHSALGQVYGFGYDYLRAETKFRDALALEPDLPREWMFLAWSLTYQQPPRPEEAERAARESIRLQPSLASAYYQLGRALMLQRRWTESIAAFEYSLKLNPSFQAPLIGIAQVQLGQGLQAEAERQITLFLERRESSVGRVVLAQILAARGDSAGALAAIERALSDGYADFATLDSSEHLASLRSDARYQQLLRKYGRS
jgi:eukaryotic-like serine/threonine-protein kinase